MGETEKSCLVAKGMEVSVWGMGGAHSCFLHPNFVPGTQWALKTLPTRTNGWGARGLWLYDEE